MDLELIKTISARKKIKLEDLAKEANLTKSTFYNYLSGRTPITAAALKKMSDILDIPIVHFFNEYDDSSTMKSEDLLPGYGVVKNTREVALVHKFIIGDYLESHGQKDFMERLPKYPVLIDGPQKGNYMCFEISGDNMYDGSFESRVAGDIVLAREFDGSQWSTLPGNSKNNFIIVHKNEGLLLRRLVDYDSANETITVKNLNAQYKDSKILLSEVIKIFVEVKLVGRQSIA